jgi:hypothetical protein
MKQDLLYIDADGRLYRGFGRRYPIIAWVEKEGRWIPSPDFGIPREEWGELVTQAEAERCYPGSTTSPLPEGTDLVRELSFEEMIRYRAELFDEYDGPITRKSPEEKKRYSDAVRPLHVKEAIAERLANRSKS